MTPSARLRLRFACSPLWRAFLLLGTFCNCVAEWPQLRTVWSTRALSSVSPTMFWLFLFIQIIFTVNAWLKEDPYLFYSGIAAGTATSGILIRLYGVRYGCF